MAAAASVTVEELGPARLGAIATRMLAPEFGSSVFGVLEAEAGKAFAGGKYVRTGALRASLTSMTAPGAVRTLTPGSLKFGTSIWYAKYQGTTGPGRHRPPSALLKPSRTMAAAGAMSTKNYILYGHRV